MTPQKHPDLIVLPCSARKATGGCDAGGPRIIDDLPADLGNELLAARTANASDAQVRGPAMSALRRYTGALYLTAAPAVRALAADGTHVLVISGGYGLVRAQEPISDYDMVFRGSRWPQRLIPRCLEAYCAAQAIKTVMAFAGRMTPYARVIRQTRWRQAGISHATLICPSFQGGGALREVPEAIGEAIVALAMAKLEPGWRTPSGIVMSWEQLA